MPCWYFEKTELSKTPSTIDGIDNLIEARYRCEGVKLMIDVGSALGLRYDVCATAAVYFHRFYMFHSFCDFHRYVTSTTCLFLAAKLEENTVSWTSLIETVKSLLTQLQFTVFGQDPEEEVMAIEKILLETLKFDLVVDLPYNHLLKFIKLLKGEPATIEQLLKMSWTFINDCLCTTLCIQWEPELVALSLLYLACHLIKFPVTEWIGKPDDYNGKWYQYLVNDVNLNIIENVCRQALDVYCGYRQQQIGQTADSNALLFGQHSASLVPQDSKSPVTVGVEGKPSQNTSQPSDPEASVAASKKSSQPLSRSSRRKLKRQRSLLARNLGDPDMAVDSQVTPKVERKPSQNTSQPSETEASTAASKKSSQPLSRSSRRKLRRQRSLLARNLGDPDIAVDSQIIPKIERKPSQNTSQPSETEASVAASKKSSQPLSRSSRRKLRRQRSLFARNLGDPDMAVDSQVTPRVERKPSQNTSQPSETEASVAASKRSSQLSTAFPARSAHDPDIINQSSAVVIDSSPEHDNDAPNTHVRTSTKDKRYQDQINNRKRSSSPRRQSPDWRNRSHSIDSDASVKRRRRRSSTAERRRLRSPSAQSRDGSRRRHPSRERRSRKRSRSEDRRETEFEFRKQQCLAILHSGKMLSKQEFEMVKSFMHRESSDSFSQEQFESLKRSLEIESGHGSGHPSSSRESLTYPDRPLPDEPYVPEPRSVPGPYPDYRYVSAAPDYRQHPPPPAAPMFMNASQTAPIRYHLVSHTPLHQHQLVLQPNYHHVVGVPVHHGGPVGFHPPERTPAPQYYLSADQTSSEARLPPSFVPHPGFSTPFYNQTVQQAPYAMAPGGWLPPQ